MPRKSTYKICIHDLILAGALAAAAVILLVIFTLANGSAPGKSILVTVNGEEYGVYSLSENQTIHIETELGENTLVIEDGTLHMEDADCPDKYCVSKGVISKKGQSIVCLPHRVVAEIRSSGADTQSSGADTSPGAGIPSNTGAESEEEFDIIAH